MPKLKDQEIPAAAANGHPARKPRDTWRAMVFAATLLAFTCSARAEQDRLLLGGDVGGLPSLPGEERSEAADAVSVEQGSIALSERSFDNVLAVRLDGYQELAPAVVLEKGWLVSRNVGIGGVYSVQHGTSELVLNGVYAPRRDVRVQLSASQSRMDGAIDQALVQTGMLTSVRKQWVKSRVRPEAGVAVFTARAAGAERQAMAMHGLEMGTLAGYMLRLAAMPMARTRVELRYQAQNIVYDNPLLTGQWRDRQASTSVDYSRRFDDCSLFRGRFTSGAGLSQADLRFERGAFSVGYLQTRSDDYQDSMVRFSYSLALDGSPQPAARCEDVATAPTPFRTLVDAAAARPSYLPSEPLTRTVAAADAPG